MTGAYQNLASAVVLQSIKDYRSAKKQLKRKPDSVEAKKTINEVTQFLLSSWLVSLTSVSGHVILEKLEQED